MIFVPSALVIVLLVIAFLALYPLAGAATIWAINTLFGFTIAYTWKTILAAMIVNTLFVTNSSICQRK